MLDAPRRLARQSTTIQRDQPIDLIQQPRDPGHGPGPHWPSGRPPSGQRQGDGARTTHFRTVSRDRPRRHGRLFRGDERLRIDTNLLRRNDVQSPLVGQAPDPPGATRAETSIPIKDQGGAFRPTLGKLAEVHTAF